MSDQGFNQIYYKGKPVERDTTPQQGMAIIIARNRLHRWWLMRRNPGMPVYLEKWLKWRQIINDDFNKSVQNTNNKET